MSFLLFGLFGSCANFANFGERWEIGAKSGSWYLDFFGGSDALPDAFGEPGTHFTLPLSQESVTFSQLVKIEWEEPA